MTFSDEEPVYDPEVLRRCDNRTSAFGGGDSGYLSLLLRFSYLSAQIEKNWIEVWGGQIRILYLPGFVRKSDDTWYDGDQVCEFLKLAVQQDKLEPNVRAEYLQKVAVDAAAWVESGQNLYFTAKRAVKASRSTAMELTGIDSDSFLPHVLQSLVTGFTGWMYGEYKPLE